MTNAATTPDGFSPGEWSLEYDGSLVIGGQVIGLDGLAPDGASPDERRANARLMSAAPNLLMAARGFIAFLDDLDRTHCGLEDFERTYPGLADAFQQAAAAVEKATGH